MRSTVAGIIVATLVAVAGWAFGPQATAQDPDACGPTTVEATIVDTNGDGILECGPGVPITVREDLAAAGADREQTRDALTAFFTIADIQLPDEESPLRGEWADKCGDLPTSGAFRPHESMVPHLMNGHVLAANRIAQDGSPVLGVPFDFAAAMGDLADNQQYNEIRWIIDILDGSQLVDPDSGADGYDGVQANDPDGAGDLAAPPEATASLPTDQQETPILNLANDPFWAPGIRNADGDPLPWYTIQGNHDAKVQGTIKDVSGWREFARAWAIGSAKVMDLAPDRQSDACAGGYSDPAFWMDILTDPTAGTTSVVPADPDRRLVNKQEWIDAHAETTGLPVGHGLLPESSRCPDVYNDPFTRRICYAYTQEPFRFIALDTNPAEGAEQGNIDEAQFSWLTDQLIASSTSYYDEDGSLASNPDGTDRLIVVFTHHTLGSMNNRETSNDPTSTAKHGADLEALLLRFPNVVLHTNGHTHENRIYPHADDERGTEYWEVNTAAITDWPHQSRTIEIADNNDGTISIFAVTFDASAHPDARRIEWFGDDPSNEITRGADRRINERWLTAAAFEEAFADDQQHIPSALGEPGDRNVELLLGAPEFLAVEGGSGSTANGTDGNVPLPRTGPGAWPTLAVGLALLGVALLARRRRTT